MPNYRCPYEYYFHRDDGSSVIAYRSKTHGYWEVIIDTDDFDRVIRKRWQLLRDRRTSYASTGARKNEKATSISMHRFIMEEPDGMVDHRNRHGLDNRKSNLRVISGMHNRANSKIPTSNTHGFKGVSYNKRDRLFAVYLTYNSNKYFGGKFKNKLLAAESYNDLVLKHCPDYGYLNEFTVSEINELELLKKSGTEKRRVKSNKYGFVGVGIDKDRVNQFKAVISINKKSFKIGNYATAVEAARAYDRMAKQYPNENKNLNNV